MRFHIVLMSDIDIGYKVFTLKEKFGDGSDWFFPHVSLAEVFCYTHKQINFLFLELAKMWKGEIDLIQDKIILEKNKRLFYVRYKTESLLNVHLSLLELASSCGSVVTSKCGDFFVPQMKLFTVNENFCAADFFICGQMNFSYSTDRLGLFFLDDNQKQKLYRKIIMR